jgi:hypothetical protein
MLDKVETQELVNLLVTAKNMADTHVVKALVSDVPLNIGIAISELKQVFGDKDILVITDELAYAANDIASAGPGYSVDGPSRFYCQLLMTDKAALAKAINAIMAMEKSV